MSFSEIANHVVEATSNIQILQGLLLGATLLLALVAVLYARLRRRVRAFARRDAQHARNLSARSEEITRLEVRIADYVEMEEGVEELKSEVRRADAIRGKSEERLRQQNDEIERVKAEAVGRMAELERLRKIVEHVEGL